MEFSPLIKGTPDWNEKYNQDIGGLCAEMDAARSSGILNTYVHTKSGTAHTLTGEGAIMRFTATAGWAAGDTISVNGLGKNPVTLEGTALPAGAFAQGTQVVAVVDGENLQFLTQSYAGQFDAISTQMSNKADKNRVLQSDLYAQFASKLQNPNVQIDTSNIFEPPLNQMSEVDYHAVDMIASDEGLKYAPTPNSLPPYFWNVITLRGNRNRAVQFAHQAFGYGADQNAIFVRSRHNDTNDFSGKTWQAWVRIATAAPSKRYEVAYADGFGKWVWDSLPIESYYCQTQEGIVIGSVACEKTDKTDIACCTQIATLPVGFRPKSHLFLPGIFRGTDHSYKGLGAMTIDANGSIQCHYSVDGCNKFVASFCFLAK